MNYFTQVENYIEWAITTTAVLLTLRYGFGVSVNLWMALSVFLVLATFDIIQHQVKQK